MYKILFPNGIPDGYPTLRGFAPKHSMKETDLPRKNQGNIVPLKESLGGDILSKSPERFETKSPSTLIVYDKNVGLDAEILEDKAKGVYCVSSEENIEQNICKFLEKGPCKADWEDIINEIKSPINSVIISDRYLFNTLHNDNPYKCLEKIITTIISKNEKYNIKQKINLLVLYDGYYDSALVKTKDVENQKEQKDAKEIREGIKDRITSLVPHKFKKFINEGKLDLELLSFCDYTKGEGFLKEHKKLKTYYRITHDRTILTNYTIGIATFRISGFDGKGDVVQSQMVEIKSIYNDANSGNFNDSPREGHERVLSGIAEIVKFLREYPQYGCYSYNGNPSEPIKEDFNLRNRMVNIYISKK